MVKQQTGPLSFIISLSDGQRMRKHVDQLRARLQGDCPSTTPELGRYKQWIRGAGPAGTWDPWGPLLFSCNVIACN